MMVPGGELSKKPYQVNKSKVKGPLEGMAFAFFFAASTDETERTRPSAVALALMVAPLLALARSADDFGCGGEIGESAQRHRSARINVVGLASKASPSRLMQLQASVSQPGGASFCIGLRTIRVN